MGNTSVPLSEIQDTAPPALQAVKVFATYVSQPETHEIAVMTLKEWLLDDVTANNPTIRLISALVFLNQGDFEEAYRVSKDGNNLEMLVTRVYYYYYYYSRTIFPLFTKTIYHFAWMKSCSMAVHARVLLQINRSDLAIEVARAMSKIDDDAPLCQLVNAWCLITQVLIVNAKNSPIPSHFFFLHPNLTPILFIFQKKKKG